MALHVSSKELPTASSPVLHSKIGFEGRTSRILALDDDHLVDDDAAPCDSCTCELRYRNQHNTTCNSSDRSTSVSSSKAGSSFSIPSLCEDEQCSLQQRRRSTIDIDVNVQACRDDGLSVTAREKMLTLAGQLGNTTIACDACPYCMDTCLDMNCNSCAIKRQKQCENKESRARRGCKKNVYTMCHVRRHNK